MPVYLDDVAVDAAGPSLGALLDAVRDRLAAEGGERVVVEVHVDGEAVGEAALAARRDEPVDGAEVRLVTADLKVLAVDTLDQVRGRLDEASNLQADAADLLQQDQAAEAFGKIGESIGAWLQVQQAVLHAAVLLKIDLNTITVDRAPAHDVTAEAVEKIHAVKDALQAGDTIALADTLAYEWPDLAARWDRLIATLIERIES